MAHVNPIPDEDWDLFAADWSVDTVEIGLASPPWSHVVTPVGTVSDEVFVFNPEPDFLTGSALATDIDCVTLAASLRVNDEESIYDGAVLASFVGTTDAMLIIMRPDGIYTTEDLATFNLVYSFDFTDTFHTVYLVFNDGTGEADVYIDSLFALSVPVLFIGVDISQLLIQYEEDSNVEWEWMAGSSQPIIPVGFSAVGDGQFVLGADSFEFNIDEFSHNPTVLDSAQVLVHYNASRGINE